MIDTTVLLYGLQIFSGKKSELLDMMYLWLKERKSLHLVATPNPEQVIQSKKSSTFLQHLQHFDLLLPDGQGLVVASKLFSARGGGKVLSERITGRELVADLISKAIEQGLSVAVIGGREYQGKLISKKFVSANPVITQNYEASNQARIFWLPGYLHVSNPTTTEEEHVISSLRTIKPAIVFVAFGAPHQEAWIIQHKKLLQEAKVVLAMAVGGSFDYLTGSVPVVPTIVEKLGLEWLFRLVSQPWRWRRQLRLLEFIGLTFKLLVKKPT